MSFDENTLVRCRYRQGERFWPNDHRISVSRLGGVRALDGQASLAFWRCGSRVLTVFKTNSSDDATATASPSYMAVCGWVEGCKRPLCSEGWRHARSPFGDRVKQRSSFLCHRCPSPHNVLKHTRVRRKSYLTRLPRKGILFVYRNRSAVLRIPANRPHLVWIEGRHHTTRTIPVPEYTWTSYYLLWQ